MVDSPKERDVIESAPPATQRQVPKLYGESGDELSEEEQFHQLQLNNKYGEFSVQHKMTVQQSEFARGYKTDITMTPNWRTRKPSTGYAKSSEIDLIQTLRSGTDGNWRTTPRDHGWTGSVMDHAFICLDEPRKMSTGRIDTKEYKLMMNDAFIIFDRKLVFKKSGATENIQFICINLLEIICDMCQQAIDYEFDSVELKFADFLNQASSKRTV